jgi:hypothetical protein
MLNNYQHILFAIHFSSLSKYDLMLVHASIINNHYLHRYLRMIIVTNDLNQHITSIIEEN